MTRLRIALVAHGIHFRGGMERYCAELACSLCNDHDVHLFTSEAGDVPEDRVTLHSILVTQTPILVKFLQFYFRSSRLLKQNDFDIVHTIGGITARQNIVTAQYCQYAWGNAIAKEPGVAEGITAYHQMMWRMTGFFEKRAVNSPQTQVVSANSERTKEDLQHFYGTDPGKIKVIYNGVDPVRFTPENVKHRSAVRQRYQISDNALVLLFVGEYRRKGLANVIRALALLQTTNVHLLAVGRGDQSHYSALAKQVGIGHHVTLAGPASDIERVFGAADIFVFPTLYEPFGMVITEAMASGLPVITSRRAGAAEMIEDSRSGLLLDNPANVEELAKKMEVLIPKSDVRREMGDKARQAVSHYDWKRVSDETLALYLKVVRLEQQVDGSPQKAVL